MTYQLPEPMQLFCDAWFHSDEQIQTALREAYAAGQRDMREAADAERYRWLRDSDNHRHEDDISVSDFDLNVYFGNDLDNEVDRLMARNADMNRGEI